MMLMIEKTEYRPRRELEEKDNRRERERKRQGRGNYVCEWESVVGGNDVLRKKLKETKKRKKKNDEGKQ